MSIMRIELANRINAGHLAKVYLSLEDQSNQEETCPSAALITCRLIIIIIIIIWLGSGRTLIHGDKKAGFTVFWADDGLDTGPILLQRECAVEPNDTVDTLYNRFLFPEGIKAMVLYL